MQVLAKKKGGNSNRSNFKIVSKFKTQPKLPHSTVYVNFVPNKNLEFEYVRLMYIQIINSFLV